MAAISWATGVSGDWATGTDWTGGVKPGSGDTVTVGVAGTYTVTIDSAEAAKSLTLDDAGATIADTAVLTIGTTLALTSGTFQLGSGGEISGGTLSATGGTFAWNGGTLSGTTYQGTLNLLAANASLIVAGGFTATGSGGTGAGLIDLTGPGSKLYATGSETLNDATLDIGAASPGTIFYVYDPADATPTLTFGSTFDVVQTGAVANIASDGFTNDSLVNDGSITAGFSGGAFDLTPFNITNNGAITASNGDTLFIDPTTFTEGATGTLSVTSGATLELGYALTTAQLAKITDTGGIIGIAGALTNTSSTLTVGPGAANPTVELDTGGVIDGGTVLDKGSGMQFDGGELAGVTYDGTLDLSTANATLAVTGGLTATTTSGTGPGTIDLTGGGTEGALMGVEGGETLDNATLNIGNATVTDILALLDPSDATPTLTLGSSFHIVQTGALAGINDANTNANDGVVNDGVITAGVQGSFVITLPNFTNNGTIAVSNGDDLFIDAPNFTEGAGGSMSVAANSELDLGYALTTAQLLQIANAGTIGIGGTLTNSATLTVGPGTTEPNLLLGVFNGTTTNGSIVGGTIVDKGSGVEFGGGTLSDVTYDGTLNLSPASASVIVNDGFVANAESGTGAGTIVLTGSGATFFATGGETLDNMTVDIGSATGGSNFYDYDPTGSTPTLTLGSHFDMVQVGTLAGIFGSGFSTDVLVNDGTITAAIDGGTFTVEPFGSLTNNGAIAVSNGDTLFLDPVDGFNPGTGTVTVSSGGILKVGFALTTAQLLSEFTDNNGVIGIAGTLTNTTLNVGSGTALPAVQLDAGGTILGGTVVDHGSVMKFLGGTLSGVTYDGALNLASAGASLIVTGGFTATGVGGTGAGVINLTGAGATFDAAGDQTLNNATLSLGAGGSFDLYNPGGAPTTLSLGSGFVINQTGASATIGDSTPTNANDTLVNEGSITAGVAAGQLTISVPIFTNTGSLTVSNGETADLSGTLTNLGGTTLTGGHYTVDAGSTLQLQNATIATDDAVIVVSGAGSVIDSLDTSNGVKTTLESTLTTIAAGGTLEVEGARNWATTNAVSNAGTLDLGGGTFTAASLANSGEVFGYGTIAAPVTDTGTLWAEAGQTLSLVGGALTNLSGTNLTGGDLTVGAGGTLQLANNTSIATLNATIELAGAGSTLQSLNTSTSKEVSLESSLATIGASGVLEVLSGRNYSTANTIANSGQIDLGGGTLTAGGLTDAAGSTLSGFGTVAAALSNAGLVTVKAGDTLSVPDGVTNLSGTTLTGGTWTVGAGGVLQLANNTSIATLDATVDLAGAGAKIQSLDTATSQQVTLESALTSIGASGDLEILGSRGYSGALAITNAGTIQLGGGSLATGKLTDSAGSNLTGFGTVASVFSDAGTVTASGGTLTFTGTGDTFAGNVTGGALALSGGSDAFGPGAALGVTSLAIAGGAAVTVNTNLGYAGTVTEAAGTTLSVSSGDTLTLSGASSTFTGTASGAGALAFAGGTNTLASGSAITVAKLTVAGATTSLALGSSRTYAGDFVESGGAVRTGASTLTLSGPASFGPSALVAGSGGLVLQGATAISGLTIGATEAVSNTGTVTQSGQITVGDTSTSAASFTNASGGVYDITSNTGIARGTAAGSLFTNAGTLAKTAGTGVSDVGVDVTDTGAITVASGGTLEFSGASNSFTGTASGAGTLEFGGGANTLASGLTLSVAKLSVAGATTSVIFGSSRTYAGDFVQSAGKVSTGAFTLTLSGPASFGASATVTGSGALALQGATAISGLTIGGTEAASNTGTVTQTGQLTVGDTSASAASFTNVSGGVYNITNNTGIGKGTAAGSLFSNAGTLAKTAGTGVSAIGVDFTDTGKINVAAGTLDLNGASNSFAGSINGPGTLALGAGASSLSTLDLAAGVALTNAGTVSQSGVLTLTNGTAANNAGATWNLTSNNGVALASGGRGSLTNAGTLAKTAGTGVSAIGVDVTDTGTVTAATGTLQFNGASNSFTGTVNGPGTVALGAGASSLSTLDLAGGVALTNAGTVSQSGVLTLTSGTVTNAAGATWNLTSDSGVTLGGSGSVTNAGTLAKTVGTGVSAFGADVTSTGTITAATGTLEFDGATNSFAGTVGGAGTVNIAGGTDTLTGVHLTAANVNLTGTSMTLSGAITDTGAVSVTGVATVAAGGASLTGAGTVTLTDHSNNEIIGATAASKLTVDTTLEATGALGAGQLTLVNQAGGTIESSGSTLLTIDTGANTITNAGLIESNGIGGLTINSAVDNTGTLASGASNMTVNDAVTGAGQATVGDSTLYFKGAFNQNVTFTAGSTGTLELADSQGYTAGSVTGFSTSGANALDLDDISYGVFTTATYSGTATSGTLTVTDGTHTAKIKLIGDYLGSTFNIAPDANFGVQITDPAASGSPQTTTAVHRFIDSMARLGAVSAASIDTTRLAPAPMHAVNALTRPTSMLKEA